MTHSYKLTSDKRLQVYLNAMPFNPLFCLSVFVRVRRDILVNSMTNWSVLKLA